MDKEKALTKPKLPLLISEAQRDFLLQRTPPAEVKQRKGRGGRTFDYIEIGYVIEQLNKVFGFDWDFEVVHGEYMEMADEVVVEGRLTVRAKWNSVTKAQFGGAIVKRFGKGPQEGQPMSIADDFKAATSDALKKCASLLGVGLDVYRGNGAKPEKKRAPAKKARPPAKKARLPEPPSIAPAKEVDEQEGIREALGTGIPHWIDDPATRKRFWQWTRETLGLSNGEVHEALGVESVKDYPGPRKQAHADIMAYITRQLEAAANEKAAKK